MHQKSENSMDSSDYEAKAYSSEQAKLIMKNAHTNSNNQSLKKNEE